MVCRCCKPRGCMQYRQRNGGRQIDSCLQLLLVRSSFTRRSNTFHRYYTAKTVSDVLCQPFDYPPSSGLDCPSHILFPRLYLLECPLLADSLDVGDWLADFTGFGIAATRGQWPEIAHLRLSPAEHQRRLTPHLATSARRLPPHCRHFCLNPSIGEAKQLCLELLCWCASYPKAA
jgi:hypothetical protein